MDRIIEIKFENGSTLKISRNKDKDVIRGVRANDFIVFEEEKDIAMKTQEQLFNEIINIKSKIQRVASIVQNPVDIPLQQLNEWNEYVNSVIKEIYDIKLEVNDFYMNKIR